MALWSTSTSADPREQALRHRDAAERLAGTLPPLLVEADRVAHTIAQGLHGRRRAGAGEAFWQFRPYRPGDMATSIDWRKSARSDRLFIRENEWEAANTMWLWVNPGETMTFQSHLSDTPKSDRAIVLSLALGSLLIRAGERIGPFGSDIPASPHRTALRRLAAYMTSPERVEGEVSSLPPALGLKRFSNIVLFSDFLDPVDEIGDRLAAIGSRDVRGHLVQVLDPAEETLPYVGRKEFQEMRGNLRLTVGRAENLRGDYQKRIAEHRVELRELVRRLGWTLTV
ncbi:MAG: DUF58 domain-containing protein, partial [Hyphomicrobiales bacterium]